jgi:1-acyl-sn-glycerol-3-phosphate acyltransferase
MKDSPPPPAPTVVSEKQYTFVPPRDSRFWPWFVGTWLHLYLKRANGIESWEIQGAEKLRASIDAGHGILLVPNHCRMTDPPSLGLLVTQLHQNIYVMASSHIFMESRLQRWLLPRVGAFSVYREGMDRESLKTAVNILATASRPLVIFAEGVVTRTNDRLITLQDGVAFMARTAAKQAAQQNPEKKVVIHPLALRYVFRGDVEKVLAPMLTKIETRLSWLPRDGQPLLARIVSIGHALLALKEIEYFGAAQSGRIPERLQKLMGQVLGPLEAEWIKGQVDSDGVQRVKNLRKAILPDLIAGELDETERARRWKQLFDLEVAQQLYHFPPDYLGSNPSPERMIETVERYEEALGNASPEVRGPFHLKFQIGDAIPVNPVRDRRAPSDPLMDQLRASLTSMLGIHDPAAAP